MVFEGGDGLDAIAGFSDDAQVGFLVDDVRNPCAFFLFVRVDSAPVFHLGARTRPARRLQAAGIEENTRSSLRAEPGARTGEINSKSLWGAFQDRAGEEISGQAWISIPPRSRRIEASSRPAETRSC